MLTLPAGTAGYLARNLAGMMALSWLFATAFSVSGLMVGWTLDIPVGATVVVIAGAVFLGSAGSRLLSNHMVKRSNRPLQQSPAKEPRKS